MRDSRFDKGEYSRYLLRCLIAVLAGNIIFFSIMSRLPEAGRHHPLHFDLGTLIDLWFCLVIFVILGYLPFFRRRQGGR